MAVMDIIIKAKDEASKVLDQVGNSGEKNGERIKSALNKASLAVSAAGAAVEGLARSQAPLTENSKRLAMSLGMTTQEVRKLAIETSNVTFPLEDVLGLMEQGRQQGIKSAEQLQEYAFFWDTVGDATRSSATELANAGVALNAIGIAAGQEKEALAAFGYVFQETSSNVSDFLTFVDRAGPELREMGMDINDTAAIMGVLEKEFGMTSRTARMEFRQAVSQSDGTVQGLLETLGVGQDVFAKYQQAVADSSNVIQGHADIHAESYTPLQKLQHAMGELTYKYGDQIAVASQFSMIMMGTGPVINAVTNYQKGLTIAQKAGAVAARALGTAMTVSLGPVGLIIAAIAAAVAIGWVLYKNWDKVVAGLKVLWEGFKVFLEASWEAIKKAAKVAFFVLTLQFRIAIKALMIAWDIFKKAFTVTWEFFKKLVVAYVNQVKKNFEFLVGVLKKVWEGFKGFFVGLWQGIMTAVKAPINLMIGMVNTLINGLNSISIDVPSWVPGLGGKNFGINIPTIPKFHTGGIFRTNNSSGEGPAILKDGERITDPMQSRRMENSGPTYIENIIELDGEVLARAIAPIIVDILRLKGVID